jgi:hypothetical protein
MTAGLRVYHHNMPRRKNMVKIRLNTKAIIRKIKAA